MQKNEDLLTLKSHFVTVRVELSSNSRTAALWILYQDLINLVRDFIRADRLSDWRLHIDSVSNSLPIFAAAGHHKFTKSAYLYLQSMLALKENNPEVYKNFSGACFVIRRSDRTWAGLSPDLVIKKVLMRALKGTGGLTRGAGFNETQRAIWLLSMPVTSAYNLKMQELTNTLFETSEQHKGSSSTRVARDQDDTKKVLSFLRQISLFESATGLKNIATGVVADNDVNVDNLISIGKRKVCEMEVKDVYKCVLKRRDKVKTMSSKTSTSLRNISRFLKYWLRRLQEL